MRPNSCGVHSIMAGRTVDNVQPLEIITYSGERMWVGETSSDQLDQILAGGGRRSEIYAALHALRERYAQQVADRYPASRAGSPATTSTN